MLLLMNNRAVRRIAGAPRFELDEHALSDLDIRRTLKVPSYELHQEARSIEVHGTHASGHDQQP